MGSLVKYFFVVCALLAVNTAAAAMQVVSVSRGGDLLEATGTLHLNLPGDFFGSGSAPVVANVSLQGIPLGTIGPYEVGTTSVVFERRTATSAPIAVSGTATVAVQASELRLKSVTPFSVAFGSVAQSWSVTVALNQSSGPYGSYSLTRTGSSQGTFTASVPVPISALFSNGSISKRVDLGVATLATSSGTWTTIAGSASAALAVGGLPLGVALTGTLTSTLMDLVISPAQVDPNRPGPAYIDSSASIDPGVGSLGRGCSIGAGVTIGSGAVIGPNAVVADNSQIGSNAIVGESASVGAGSTLGADAYVDASVVLNAGCQLSAGSTVLYASNLGSGCKVGVEATVRESCVLRGNCTIGAGATLERNVHCGSSVTFAANMDIADGATIPSSTSVTDSIVKCYLLNGTFEYRSLPVSSWPSFVAPPTASVHQDSGARSDGGNAQSSVSTPPADPNNPPSGSGQLPADVGSDVARPSCGGTGQEYMAGTYMCGWFAETLRHKLEDLGYSTSFTVVYRKNPNYSWWKIRSKKWMDGHALTDVHWSNGTTTWIEAQFVGTDGVGQPKLDANGDGKVTHYDHASGDDTTDGDLRIEVYDNRAQAETAGNSIPGN